MFEPTATLPRFVELGYARPLQKMKAAAILGSIKRSGKYFQSCVRGVMKLRWDAYPRSTGKPGQLSLP